MDDNLFQSLSVQTLRNFAEGDGGELVSSGGNPPGLHAGHSSAALACNFFEYWRFRDKTILSDAFRFRNSIKTFVFEQKLSMGMRGKMPNLDLFMILADGSPVAIECKFTEWMNKKRYSKAFAESYFPDGRKRWDELGLPNCQKLAENLFNQGRSEEFVYLNAPQLLKHSLGLANKHSCRSTLIYLYYDADGEIGRRHFQEIERYRDWTQGELNFTPITYQTVFERMSENSTRETGTYLSYLAERYFNPVKEG